MIISASGGTDIPALYSDWFFKRLEGRYLYVKSPMNPGQVSRILLSQDTVDCFVFWAKDPGPMMEELSVLDRLGYLCYLQFTPTSYGTDVEPGLPHKNELVKAFRELSARLGSERVIWRHDLVFLSPSYIREYHSQWLSRLCSSLEGCTRACVISFLGMCRKIEERMDRIQTQAITGGDMVSLASFMGPGAERHDMTVRTCSEAADLSGFHIQKRECIGDQLIVRLLGRPLDIKEDSTQRGEYGCVKSVGVGAYNTYSHLYRYCYANFNPDRVEVKRRLHDPDSPFLYGRLTGEERIAVRKMKSVVCPTGGGQICLIFDVSGDEESEWTTFENECR